MQIVSSVYNYCFGTPVIPIPVENQLKAAMREVGIRTPVQSVKRNPLQLLIPFVEDGVGSSVLSNAIRGGNVELVRYISRITPVKLLDTQFIDGRCSTALILSIHYLNLKDDSHQWQIFKIFLEKGVDTNWTPSKWTPLRHCLNRGMYIAARHLVANGANYIPEWWKDYKVAITIISINETLAQDVKHRILHIFINTIGPFFPNLDNFDLFCWGRGLRRVIDIKERK